MKTPRNARKLQNQLSELSVALPAIVTHRLLNPSERETERMIAEKAQAFTASWIGMYSEMATLPWRWSLDVMQSVTTGRSISPGKIMGDLNDVAAAGLKPVYDTAMANKRRLSKRKS